jgi:hypothetical protein
MFGRLGIVYQQPGVVYTSGPGILLDGTVVGSPDTTLFDQSLIDAGASGGSDGGLDVISSITSIAGIASASELSALILRSPGNKLLAHQGDSAWLVAMNHSLQFSVVKQSDGTYAITDRLGGVGSTGIIIAAVAVAILVPLLISGRR